MGESNHSNDKLKNFKLHTSSSWALLSRFGIREWNNYLSVLTKWKTIFLCMSFILYMIATIDNLEKNCQKYISGR